jgi:hypothetical protein
MHDVIRLKQVEHVKNEKNILQVRPTLIWCDGFLSQSDTYVKLQNADVKIVNRKM